MIKSIRMIGMSALAAGLGLLTTPLARAQDSVFVTTTGDVGVGTSTPAVRLDVKANASAAAVGRIQNSSATGYAGFEYLNQAGNVISFLGTDNANSTTRFNSINNYPITILTNSVERMRITSTGNIGIGTASPEANFHIFGSNTADAYIGLGPNPDGSPGTESAYNLGYGGSSFGRGAGFLNVRPDSGATAPNPSLRFLTSNVVRMIIDNEGFMGLGVANPSSPIEHSSGAILTAGGTWQNGSSRDTKQDIVELEPAEAMAALQGLDPIKFAYKVDPKERHIGFIAEDVPDLVASPDRKSLSPMDIVAVLTKVVQEQQKTIDELTAKVTELQQQIQ